MRQVSCWKVSHRILYFQLNWNSELIKNIIQDGVVSSHLEGI